MLSTFSRRTVASLLVGILVLSAGCSGFGLGDDATESPSPDSDTPSMEPTTTGDATATPGSDGHDHNETTTDDGSENQSSNDATTGKVTIMVAGTELDLKSLDQDGDGFGIASDEHTWVARQSGLTLAEALTRFDVDAQADQLTFDGETYNAGDDGTRLTYRVNGESVDPESYELEDGDRIWITVATEDMDASTPGTYIKRAQQHAHGTMTMTVDGERVDFSQEKYQSNDRYFHFEGGDGEKWHAHSWSLTPQYSLSSLSDINVSQDGSITYNGTTYDDSDAGTSVTIEVNGEPVDVNDYYLNDGDTIRVVVET